MPHRQCHVEVITHIDRGVAAIKREPAKDWTEAQKLAEQMATAMFPEDPMASRTFRNGRYVYSNMNDLGDLVTIRPMIAAVDQDLQEMEIVSCGSQRKPPGEPA